MRKILYVIGFAFQLVARAINDRAPLNLRQPTPEEWTPNPLFMEKSPINRVAWEKTYTRPEDVGARLANLLRVLRV